MFLGPHPGRTTKLDAFFVFACLRLFVGCALSNHFSSFVLLARNFICELFCRTSVRLAADMVAFFFPPVIRYELRAVFVRSPLFVPLFRFDRREGGRQNMRATEEVRKRQFHGTFQTSIQFDTHLIEEIYRQKNEIIFFPFRALSAALRLRTEMGQSSRNDKRILLSVGEKSRPKSILLSMQCACHRPHR